jgi:glc operon protein GlcG
MKRTLTVLSLTLGLATLPQSLAGELTTKKSLNLAAIKTMVAAAEAEAQNRKVQVTLCVADDNGTVIFLQKADGAGINTIQFAQRKAQHAALYRSPSKNAADTLKGGNLQVLIQPGAFPNQGGLPIRVDGQVIGAISASGAASEVDEAIAQAGIDALNAWLKQ